MILGLSNIMGSDDNWPILISLTAVPAVLQAILRYFLPESPRYLILENNDIDSGRKALAKLRDTDDIDDEIEEIKAEAAAASSTSNSSSQSGSLSVWQLIISPNLRLALFVTVCMHLSQQFSGISAIFYYSTGFFQVSCRVTRSGHFEYYTHFPILQSAG